MASLRTWLRLSEEGEESEPYPLKHESQFKLSSNQIFQCKISGHDHRKTVVREKCRLCNTGDQNCFIKGCNHAVGCYDCVQKLRECPICGDPICEIEQMFPS